MPSAVTVRRGYLAEAELTRFLECSRDELELLWWLLMCDAGLRAGEVRRLYFSDINGGKIRVKGKGRKVRLVPVTRRIERVLAAVVERYPVNALNTICSLQNRTLQRRFDNVLSRARIRKEKLCPHSLRHTFATRLLCAGVDIHRVGVLLGHASTMTTVGYLHTNEDALNDARDRLDRINGDEPLPGGHGGEGDRLAGGASSPANPKPVGRTYAEVGELVSAAPSQVANATLTTPARRPSPLDKFSDLV
jgi:integrase